MLPFPQRKSLTGLDEKERCFELMESIRCHVMIGCLHFLLLQLRLVSRQHGFPVMVHTTLNLVIIFQVFIPRRRVVVWDVIGIHTLSGTHTYPDCRVCVRKSMKGLILFVSVINQPESRPKRQIPHLVFMSSGIGSCQPPPLRPGPDLRFLEPLTWDPTSPGYSIYY